MILLVVRMTRVLWGVHCELGLGALHCCEQELDVALCEGRGFGRHDGADSGVVLLKGCSVVIARLMVSVIL